MTRRTSTALVGIAASITALQCSASRESFPEKDDTNDASGPPVSFGDGGGDAAVDAFAPLMDCAPENKLIYVLSRSPSVLYRFDPEQLTFTKIGQLHCATGAQTFSMAVDRRGTAWVEYDNGRIFRVSTRDATCEATPYRIRQHNLTTFGMGFAKDDAEPGAPLTESLYLAGHVLGRLDLDTFVVSVVGNTAPGHGELTGTASGVLYALLPTGLRIVRVDKSTGAPVETFRPNIDPLRSFAFAQWGGDFWLFHTTFGENTTVTRYSPATDTTTVMLDKTDYEIVGAGSSTCAPDGPIR